MTSNISIVLSSQEAEKVDKALEACRVSTPKFLVKCVDYFLDLSLDERNHFVKSGKPVPREGRRISAAIQSEVHQALRFAAGIKHGNLSAALRGITIWGAGLTLEEQQAIVSWKFKLTRIRLVQLQNEALQA